MRTSAHRLLDQATPAIGRGGQPHDSDLANGPAHWEGCQLHHLLPMVHWCRAGDLEPLECGEETQVDMWTAKLVKAVESCSPFVVSGDFWNSSSMCSWLGAL